MEFEQEIKGFLMSRRERITPGQAGLPHVGGDRRVKGLRREEVAMLAGLSVEYYTRIERGRLGGASDSVLDAIARALQLDDDERAHLHQLARNVAPGARRRRTEPRSPITASVQQVLDSMSVPAVVMNDRLDLLAANDLGRALYADLFDMAQQPANFARYVFLDPRAAAFYTDLDEAKNQLVAILRATAGRDPLDTEVTALIGELSTRSVDFSTRWAKHNVARHTTGHKTIHHPAVGTMDLAYNDFTLPGDPHIAITTYTADPGTPSADALTLLATWAETQKQHQTVNDDVPRIRPRHH
ncbi:helix-turn-helix domain-containing protein [Skermania sp. ID1734]|uniref:helix-turn-helix transcriptional regulator n=1 Tax=Skermania sp. ID1734 TaxID=2597516 RepID=UPI0011816B2F|nr:helix-turn-helix transcriptional regulator [Skermania sp. ID1734]TSD92855.1 helix-turn-helix domain-containing protein [Skermania sp. ID1734]